MAQPFLGQISIFSFSFPPKGWALCNGQILPINQNQALFALLGTTYGGNGQTTFALPNLQGCAAMHFSPNHPQGEVAGTEQVSLTIAQMPAHAHTARCNTATSDALSPAGAVWGADTQGNAPYATSANGVASPSAIKPAGDQVPHNNMAPSLVINFCIALQGIFPSRN